MSLLVPIVLASKVVAGKVGEDQVQLDLDEYAAMSEKCLRFRCLSELVGVLLSEMGWFLVPVSLLP